MRKSKHFKCKSKKKINFGVNQFWCKSNQKLSFEFLFLPCMYFNFMDQDQKEVFSFFHDALDSTVSHQQDDSEVTSSKRKG